MGLIITNKTGWACSNVSYSDIAYLIESATDLPRRQDQIVCDNIFICDDAFFKVGDAVECVFKDDSGIVGFFGTIYSFSKEIVRINVRRSIEDYTKILDLCK